MRGQDPQFYTKQLKALNGDNIFPDLGFYKPTYFQAAEPVRDQQTADGHAVRVGYLCTGVAHVGRLLGDRGLIDTAKRFWKNIVTRRMYVTGAIGSTHVGESFTYDYDLPNDTMYGETCASVAMSMFAQQMLDCSTVPLPASRSTASSTTTSMHWRPRLTDWITRTATTCSPTASTGSAAPAARPTSPDSSPPWTATSTPSATAARPC